MASVRLEVVEEIDAIMAEMEAKTPKSGDKDKKFEEFHNGVVDITQTILTTRILYENGDKPSEKLPDDVDAKGFWNTSPKPQKPGQIHPSKPTDEKYYDFTHKRVGAAIIFNQMNVKGESERKGSQKDAHNFSEVLFELGFDVKIRDDFTVRQIKEELVEVSKRDHSDNDCLLVCIMTHGKKDGKVFAADGEFMVQDLWENFIGNKCLSLIGKPKLFFIQACRGTMADPGVLYKPKPKARLHHDAVDAKPVNSDNFVIPSLADLLVMYSTAEGFYSFRNPTDGSWFIQALCEEFRENKHEDLLTILTGVNRRVAFAKQSNVPHDDDFDAMKQMPNIVSMLTKTLYFTKKAKTLQITLENA